MSTKPRWVRPAISTVAICAVGVTSVILGSSLAPAPASESKPTTVQVPVYGPSGYGLTAPFIDLDGDPTTLETSPVQEFAELPLGEDGFVDLGADDRQIAVRSTEPAVPAGDEPGLPDAEDLGINVIEDDGADDPCAPVEGEAPETCPDGIEGAVFALDEAEELWVLPSTGVHCEAEGDDPADLPFGILGGAPGEIEVTYFPSANPGDTHTVTTESTPEQNQRWADEFAAYDPEVDPEPVVEFCLVVPNLEPRTAYQITTTLTALDGRTATFSYEGHSWDERTRPPAIIVPIAPNMLKVSAAHADDVTVKPSFRMLAPSEAPDCSVEGDDFWIPTPEAYPSTSTIPDSYLELNHYLPKYNERTTFVTYVPEGSRILVCIAEFEDERPTWDWFDAQYRTSAIVNTPNYARPVVSVDSMRLNTQMDADAVSVRADWGTMDSCTLFRGPATATRDVELPEPGERCGGEQLAITQGNVVIGRTVTYQGETTRTPALLLLGRVARTGTGPLPETSYFTLPLTIDPGEVEMCGSGVRAPCDPIEAAGAVGTVTIRVDWIQGEYNGFVDWNVGEKTSGEVENELAATPQVDFIHHQMEVGTIEPRGGPVEVTYLLTVDRQVAYSVTLEGECTIPGQEMTVTGSTSSGSAVMSRDSLRWLVCPGEGYHMTGTLTDEDGNTTVFGPSNPWSGGGIRTPNYESRVAVSYTVERTDMAEWEGPLVHVTVLDMTVNGEGVALDSEGRCMEKNRAILDLSHGMGHREMALSSTVDITFRVQFNEAYGGWGGGRAPVCADVIRRGAPVELHATVPLESFREGAVITWDEGTPYRVTLTLQDVGPAE